MVGLPHGPDDFLGRALSGLPRHEAPELPLVSIFEVWQGRRRRAAVAGGLAVAASLLALVLIRPTTDKPPVHLQLEVVDVPAAEVLGAGEATPEEPGP